MSYKQFWIDHPELNNQEYEGRDLLEILEIVPVEILQDELDSLVRKSLKVYQNTYPDELASPSPPFKIDAEALLAVDENTPTQNTKWVLLRHLADLLNKDPNHINKSAIIDSIKELLDDEAACDYEAFDEKIFVNDYIEDEEIRRELLETDYYSWLK
ncbi:MAG: hypothetical protein ABIA04_07610 [Pseudomonadota bacterium]